MDKTKEDGISLAETFEAARAEEGAKLRPRLAEKLTEEFGRGFDVRSLEKMRQFYFAFPIADALRPQLSWTHYRTLMRVEDEHAREWYANEAVAQNWSSRALERQVSRLYYERLLSSKDREAVRAEADEKIAELPPSPRDIVRYSVMHGNEKLFAARYKLVLPTEGQLRVELIREQRLLEERAERKRRLRK